MQLISFDPLRTWGIPNTKQIKPDHWLSHMADIKTADWIVFPEAWQINTLVHGLKKRVFPSVSSYQLGYSKVEMTYAFQAVCPDHVPYTQIVPRTESSIERVFDDFPLPFVAKEIRNARGQGVFLIENKEMWLEYAQRNEILYAQEYLPINRDLRVVVVGDEIVTAYWRVGHEGGFHNNVARGGTISFDDIPQNALELVLQVAAELEVNHAGFDVALVDGHCYLLEFNMRFGNQALREMGIPISPRIYEYLHHKTSAVQR